MLVIPAWWCGERSALAQSVPGTRHVVDVRRAAGDVRDAVVAGNSCADDLHSAPPVAIVVYFPTAVVVRSNESPRAAAATASMIFE